MRFWCKVRYREEKMCQVHVTRVPREEQLASLVVKHVTAFSYGRREGGWQSFFLLCNSRDEPVTSMVGSKCIKRKKNPTDLVLVSSSLCFVFCQLGSIVCLPESKVTAMHHAIQVWHLGKWVRKAAPWQPLPAPCCAFHSERAVDSVSAAVEPSAHGGRTQG